MKQITFRQYRAGDLGLFALILVIGQLLIGYAASHWYADQLYIVSPVAAVVAIVMMRWGWYAAIHACVGGAAICLSLGGIGSWKHLLIYVVGNLLAMAAMAVRSRCGEEKIRKNTWLTLMFGVLVQVLMLAGRMLMALLMGDGWTGSLGFVATDTLSIIFTMVVVWIARRVDGLFEDQKHYLRRVNNEDKTEGGESI